MKLFRQKDELFELMAKATTKNNPEPTPSMADGTSTSSRRARTTPTTRPLARPTAPTIGGTPIVGPVGGTPPSTSDGGTVGGASRPAKRATTTKGVRPFGAQSPDSGSFASPLGGPPIQRPLGELIEIEGDALVVLDDDWEAAAPPSEPIGRLLALRLDTAVVGGLLVVGLLATAFLVGRTSSDDPAKLPTIAQAPLDASMPAAALTSPLQASAPTNAGTSSAPNAGFRPGNTPAATAQTPPATPAAAERSAAKGKHEIRVVSTRPEKGAAVAKWFNENPRSPIFGRTDLEATAKDGHVRIGGFAQREAEVLARVKATNDPTGGSGTFHDAYWASVR